MTDKHNEVTLMRTDTTQSGAEATPASTASPNIGMIAYYILAHVPDMKPFVLQAPRSHHDSKRNPKDAAFKNKRG